MRETMQGPVLDAQGNGPPEGFKVDVFCIGAAKSGSTWLARMVEQHPQVQVSDPKEPNFLTARGSPYLERPPKNHLTSWDWYRGCFPQQAAVNADFSIHTMADPDAARRIRSVFPEARFLLILRDPVKRLYSHYRHEERTKQKGVEYVQGLEPTFEAALRNEAFVDRSRYAKLLAPWLDVFPKERFLVLTTEAARADPLDHVQAVFRFLGVDDSFEPKGLQGKVHPHRLQRGILKTIDRGAKWARGHGLGWFVAPIGKRFPYRLVSRLDRKKVRYESLDAQLEERLRHRFLPDVDTLEREFGLDLSAWKPRS